MYDIYTWIYIGRRNPSVQPGIRSLSMLQNWFVSRKVQSQYSVFDQCYILRSIGTLSGAQLRNRRIQKCKHYDKTQYSEANPRNKEGHLKRVHGITELGKQIPSRPMDKFTAGKATSATASNRRSESSIQLTTTVILPDFKAALITLVVLCQLSFYLVVDQIFIEFLKTIFPMIEEIIPSSSNTIRAWILEAFKERKAKMIEVFGRSKSMVHFSFDLWTSPNHLALLGIVAHYIDEYGQNQSVSDVPFSRSRYNTFFT